MAKNNGRNAFFILKNYFQPPVYFLFSKIGKICYIGFIKFSKELWNPLTVENFLKQMPFWERE